MRFIHKGFSLIELMLTLAISAILIAIAYPTYIHYQVLAQRSRAEAALLQLAGRLERYYGDHGSYLNATTVVLQAAELVDGLEYQLRILNVSESHYEIQAVPEDVQAKRDLHCGVLSLTDTNIRNISGDANVGQCWM